MSERSLTLLWRGLITKSISSFLDLSGNSRCCLFANENLVPPGVLLIFAKPAKSSYKISSGARKKDAECSVSTRMVRALKTLRRKDLTLYVDRFKSGLESGTDQNSVLMHSSIGVRASNEARRRITRRNSVPTTNRPLSLQRSPSRRSHAWRMLYTGVCMSFDSLPHFGGVIDVVS